MFYDAFSASTYFVNSAIPLSTVGQLFRQYFSPYLALAERGPAPPVSELFRLWLGKQRQEGRRDFSNYQLQRKGLAISLTGLLECFGLTSLDFPRIKAHSAKLFLNEHLDDNLAILPSFVRYRLTLRFCLFVGRSTGTPN